ncbi:MAG: TetR/AcrR family transcriptional regulator [Mobilitalea sp.]
MKKANYVKEKIIAVTTDLIQSSSGKIEEITTRMIAEQAGVGIGLINYHFVSKDQLIEICVQRIISNVIASFRPEVSSKLNPIERLKIVAKLVIDFLLANPAVSRISIVGDYNNPKILDNTMKTMVGFSNSLVNYSCSEADKKILLFDLTSILQAAFLRKDISKECFGLDFNKKEERDYFIDLNIEKLFR